MPLARKGTSGFEGNLLVVASTCPPYGMQGRSHPTQEVTLEKAQH